MIVELTDDEATLVRNMIETYPLQGNLRGMRADIAKLEIIIDKFTPKLTNRLPIQSDCNENKPDGKECNGECNGERSGTKGNNS